MTLSSTTPRPLIAGNWKMNGLSVALDEARAVAAALEAKPPAARVAIFPPATLLHRLSQAVEGAHLLTGGQDCHGKSSGAHTGDVSAEMIADAGGSLVICGHSERRTDHGETSAQVAGKAEAAAAAGLEPIVCVGETLETREAGQAVSFVVSQVRDSLPTSLAGKAFSVAYEPLWAIGTGRTASVDNIVEMHAAIRAELVSRFGEQGRTVLILYGGSVKPENAREILAAPEVGGALVGGASLKAKDFLAIIQAL
ncbi:triose-phosphate isomerase [Caulobacter vibrioides]|uniref:triose-phosphate isomerase n=1 Tax=Caulobacter vibrioides TaxID=155892 RepID=UPI000BB50E44|nr:triose-phosphate isomerase [Caulobacter vibrioides]ATC24859.1 triose-phosphate isomerase [Caulobacter vibrioides]AZH13018.1 triose-phosphate isomerase [Caulobacter vibrioides]PLR09636.1 triose-phosphate isomerase [Caulobacter vibrioides]